MRITSDLLKVENLKTYYFTQRGAVKTVDDISLKVRTQEAVGLVGESGCGKSTLALSIIGLVQTPPGRIVDGKIWFDGEDILRFSAKQIKRMRGEGMSMVFQDPMTYLNPVLKVGDQISEVILTHQNVDKNEARRRVVKLLEKVGMPSPSRIVNCYPHELSGGMRQRVLISIAVACQPSLLLLDEPTSALDVTVQRQILDLIGQLREQLKTSLLLITHDLGIVAELCDKVYVMYAGKIVELADVFSLYETPKHPYTIRLLQSTLSIDEFKKKLVTVEGTVPDLTEVPPGCRFHPRCPQAMAVCSQQAPPSIQVGQEHEVACWLYRE